MRYSFLIILLGVFLLSACGTSNSPSGDSSAPVSLASLPATVEGFLVIDVEEGDEDIDGASEFNFGTLTTGSEEIPVYISGAVMSKVSLPATGGKVKATLGSKSDEYGSTNYTVTSLQLL